MRALVVVESMFGNTRAVADEIAAGLRETMPADVVDAREAPAEPGPDVTLLVAGGPTHAFGMSRPSTRADAVKQGATAPADRGLREWLATVRPERGRDAAAFGTRVPARWAPGCASRPALRALRRAGLRPLAPAESFHVEGTPGPLAAGELERAHAWGRSLAARHAPATHGQA